MDTLLTCLYSHVSESREELRERERERERDEINWVKCCCSVKEKKKQELITGFTNVKVTGILDKSCCGGAGYGKGQKPEQSGFRRKC